MYTSTTTTAGTGTSSVSSCNTNIPGNTTHGGVQGSVLRSIVDTVAELLGAAVVGGVDLDSIVTAVAGHDVCQGSLP